MIKPLLRGAVFFDEVSIDPHQLVLVQARIDPSYLAFRGEDIRCFESVPGATYGCLWLGSGRRQLPPNAELVALSTYSPSPSPFSSGYKIDTWEKNGVPLQFQVENRAGEPVKWSAMILGKVVL